MTDKEFIEYMLNVRDLAKSLYELTNDVIFTICDEKLSNDYKHNYIEMRVLLFDKCNMTVDKNYEQITFDSVKGEIYRKLNDLL